MCTLQLSNEHLCSTMYKIEAKKMSRARSAHPHMRRKKGPYTLLRGTDPISRLGEHLLKAAELPADERSRSLRR